jgi:tetratricopeptide (TPR) repeat protein
MTALRQAETLLRQGSLEAAIAEYVRVLDERPGEWSLANTLGDLYVRAGQADKAIAQYVRVADMLHADGFVAKAGAVYKKILKLEPDHDHALLQIADIAERQGLLADARICLSTVAEARRRRGDSQGEADARIRLANLDRADEVLTARPVSERAVEVPNDAAPIAAAEEDTAGSSREQEWDLVTPPCAPAQGEHDACAVDVSRDDPDVMPSDAVAELGCLMPTVPTTATIDSQAVEVDLTIELGDIGGLAAGTDALDGLDLGLKPRSADLEAVFRHFREEAAVESTSDDADALYARALSLVAEGRIEESMQQLQSAARSPRRRFEAASGLARLHRELGNSGQAIEWFERALEAPASSSDATHSVLYELADLLEAAGEGERALAIWLELQAHAGEYRDAGDHIDRLHRVRT